MTTEADTQVNTGSTGPKIRIKSLEYLRPAEIDGNERNWRRHGKDQSQLLRRMIETVGVAGACVAYRSERNGGRLTLIDGHLRRDLLETVPVLILDVTDAEADMLLASYDRITVMAEEDRDALAKLLGTLEAADDALLNALSNDGDISEEKVSDATATYPVTPVFDEGYDSVTIFCRGETDFARLSTLLGLERKKKTGAKQVGLCRVIEYEEFAKKWESR